MKLKKILFIICLIYISAYSRDILQYHKIMSDRNLNISLDSINIKKENIFRIGIFRMIMWFNLGMSSIFRKMVDKFGRE